MGGEIAMLQKNWYGLIDDGTIHAIQWLGDTNTNMAVIRVQFLAFIHLYGNSHWND